MSDKTMKEATSYKKRLNIFKGATDASNKDKKTPYKGKRILRITEPELKMKGGGIAIKGTDFKGVR